MTSRFRSFLVILAAGAIIAPVILPFSPVRPQFAVVAADDDDDEDEDEDDDDEDEDKDDDDDDDDGRKAEAVSVTRYEIRKVSQVVTVLPPEYRKDTDGDLLVDGIDPHPLIHEKEFFTDTDGDAIPDAFDRHHDEDDFSYYEGEEDADGNGIIDSYEFLAQR